VEFSKWAPKHFWKEPISLEAIGKVFYSRLVDALGWDKDGKGNTKFRELITESLRLMAEKIKREWQK
jgi:hypothetical protein